MQGGTRRIATSLKQRNRWKLYLAIAINFALYSLLAHPKPGVPIVLSVEVLSVYSVVLPGLGILLASILTAQLSPITKARLVSLRWKNPLPGSFAFTKYAALDERIDLTALRKLYGHLPQLPKDQNVLWYKMYKAVESDASVEQVHQEYLLTRDLTAVVALLFPVLTIMGIFDFPTGWQVLLLGLVLAAEFIVFRRAAAQHSVRFVSTVLAITSAGK